MNLAMSVNVSVIVIALLFGQVFSASLLTKSVHGREDSTTMQIPTEYPQESIEKQVHDHQAAIKWLKVYNYLPQEEGNSCESCDPNECAEDCLEVLEEIIVEPLKEFQKFYEFEITGVLTAQDINQMNQPRCGDADEEKDDEKNQRQKRWIRYTPAVWPADLMPLSIKVHSGIRNFRVSDIEEVALECAEMWAKPSSLWFQLADPEERKGNIDITFQYIDGPWNSVGIGLSPVVHGDKSSYLKLDRDEIWKRDAKTLESGVSLKWAICHEMGHNLGLKHSQDRKAIMYPSGNGQNEQALPRDDYTRITQLYRGPNGKTVVGRSASQPATVGYARRSQVVQHPNARRLVTQKPITTKQPVIVRHPVTRRTTTRRPTTRRRTVRRPTTQRPVWRPSPTRVPVPPTVRYNSQTTQRRDYKPTNGKRYPPNNHIPKYRPPSTPVPTPAPRTTKRSWHFNPQTNQWVYGW